MERLFLECAVRAALLVAGTAIVLYAMRVKAAAARHSVWAAVVRIDAGAPDLDGLGTKGFAARAAALGLEQLQTRQ